MKIKYQIFPEQRFIIIKPLGDFNIDHYTEYSNHIVKDPHWNNIDKMLTDIRDLNTEKIHHYLDKMAEIRRDVYKRDYINVFIVDTPISTAISHLYQNFLTPFNFRYKYCSTIKETMKSLNLNFTEEYTEELIKNLSNSYISSN